MLTFGEKLKKLRTESGLSELELSQKLSVTMLDVEDWEDSIETPDVDMIIKISDLFNVSTDYLLKDGNVGLNEFDNFQNKIDIDDVISILDIKKIIVKKISLGILFVFISSAPLFALVGIEDTYPKAISEDMAFSLGLITFLLLIAVGIGLIVDGIIKNRPYKYIDNGDFMIDEDTREIIIEQKEDYRRKIYNIQIIMGVIFCILSLVPFVFIFNTYENTLYLALFLSTHIVLLGVGINALVNGKMYYKNYDKLLKIGAYRNRKRKLRNFVRLFTNIYWTIILIIYFGYGFITYDWLNSWKVVVPFVLLYFLIVMLLFSSKKYHK